MRAALLTLATTVTLAGSPRRALAQACCAGGAVVTPARLALHEDIAAGLQLRARSNGGSFDSNGRYTVSDGVEQVFEQDLAASFRIGDSPGQVGMVLPMIQTHRSSAGLDGWGGGLGDISLNGRYDFLLAAEALYWPGFGLLAAATLPTGTPPDRATHVLAADATGAGTYDLTGGASLEKVSGHLYAALNAWVTHRFGRTVTVTGAGSTPSVGSSVTQSFAPRVLLLGVAGYVFDSEAALGLYVNAMNEGSATIDGVKDSTSRLRMTTLGLAGVLPFREAWRLQGSVFTDARWSGFGRNEVAGAGLTASVVRVWL